MLSHGNVMHNVTNVHASISPPARRDLAFRPPRLALLRAHRGVLQPLLRRHHRVFPAFRVEESSMTCEPSALSTSSSFPALLEKRRKEPREEARAGGGDIHTLREVLPGLLGVRHGPLPPVPKGGAPPGDLRGRAAAGPAFPCEAGLPFHPSKEGVGAPRGEPPGHRDRRRPVPGSPGPLFRGHWSRRSGRVRAHRGITHRGCPRGQVPGAWNGREDPSRRRRSGSWERTGRSCPPVAREASGSRDRRS